MHAIVATVWKLFDIGERLSVGFAVGFWRKKKIHSPDGSF
jgi:hypothetical protein